MENQTLDELREQQLRAILTEMFGEVNETAWAELRPSFEWEEVAGGERLFSEGDPSEHFYLVVSGRLQALKMGIDGQNRRLNEIGRGESIGEMALLMSESRSASVVAMRDSALVRLEKKDFERLLKASENMVKLLFRNLIGRLKQANEGRTHRPLIQTLAVVSLSPGLDATAFCTDFRGVLAKTKRVAHLDARACHAALGHPEAFSASDWHNRLTLWLNEREGGHDSVIYETDLVDEDWTRRCFRQADAVILLADATRPPDLTAFERQWLIDGAGKTGAPRYLVLLHPSGTKAPSGTASWLEKRSVERHFHLRKGHTPDLERLARFVQNRAVGLVMAGGGARGLAHLGIVRALRERGIPVDFYGGTSAGAIISGFAARFEDTAEMLRIGRISSMSNPTVGDFALLPMISLLTGKKMEWSLDVLFEKQMIEDLWYEFYAVSSNMTRSEVCVHRRGAMKRCIQASVAIPGIFPPVVFGNDLHIDGGVMDNLPIDIMRQMGAGRIIAADLETEKDYQLNYDDMPSAKQVLGRKILGKKPFKAPSIIQILQKSAVLGSNEKARQLAATADLFLSPDVRGFGFADWTKYDALVQHGYDYGRRMLENVDPADWV